MDAPARTFLALLVLYLAAHVLLRLLVSPILTVDDAREAVLAQTLAWGYLPRQPPLYNWLVWAAFRIVGPGVLGLSLVKYACLGTTLGAFYLAARRTLAEPRWAALTAFSLLLVIPVTWVIHDTLTHNVAAMAAAAVTYWLVLRLEDRADARDFALLGLALGAGALSKFNFLFFAATLLVAALAVPAYRARLLRLPALAAPAVALAVASPYALWFQARRLSFAGMAAEELDPEIGGYLAGVAVSALYIARMAVYYSVPLVLAFVACFGAGWARRRDKGPADRPAVLLVQRFVLAAFAILGGGALLGALTYLKFRWLLPAFFLFPLLLFARLERRPPGSRRLIRYAAILVAAELLVMVAIVANVTRGDRLGRPSRLTVPYDRIALELRAAGFTRGTIVAGEGPLAGNLRLQFPASRVVRLTNPDYLPPPRALHGQCLVVWDRERDLVVPPPVREWASRLLRLDLPGDLPGRTAVALYHHAESARHEVRYVLLPEGRGDCR